MQLRYVIISTIKIYIFTAILMNVYMYTSHMTQPTFYLITSSMIGPIDKSKVMQGMRIDGSSVNMKRV